ncbi:MAG: cytochrome b, partial [Alphaproteobacteria bacterium]|nr:cytochrome b [Alphaproteobacteria bacterium]
VVVLHIAAMHVAGSNNPIGIDPKGPQDTLPFSPYYVTKDGLAVVVFLIFYAGFVFFAPDFFGEVDNYIPANPLQTPPHIVPEWYFLPYYAILRGIPDKLGGVIAMFGSIFVLFLLPWLDTAKVRSSRFRPIYKWFFWVFVIDAVILGWVGGNPADAELAIGGLHIPLVWIGRLGTAYWFFHFLILLPILGKIERPLPLPASIAESVLKPAAAR